MPRRSNSYTTGCTIRATTSAASPSGAHGSGDRDGTPVVQFDVKKNQKKVIAFLHPFYQEKYGATLKGTYATAVDPAGDKLYITWNISRGSKAWDCCGLTVIHIPASERPL